MTLFAAQALPVEDQALLQKVRTLIARLPDTDLGSDEEGERIVLSCHILARALAAVFPELTVKDGYFALSISHSWLKTPRGNLIDPYPVGILGGPILVDGFIGSMRMLWMPLPTSEILGDRAGRESFMRAVAQVAALLERSLAHNTAAS